MDLFEKVKFILLHFDKVILLTIYFEYVALLDTSSPLLQFQRFRGKINIQRPRKPHYDRALFNAVTRPEYVQPTVTELCSTKHATNTNNVGHVREKNPYEKIIAKEVVNWFTNSQMVAIFHVNAISADDMFNVRVQLFKQNMHLKVYSKHIMSEALLGTKFESVLPLFNSSNGIVFSPEPNLHKLLKTVKKIPQMMLLAGIVEDRLMSKTQLQTYADLPSLDIVRAQFAAVLQNAGGNSLVTLLQANQTVLAGALDSHVSQQTNQQSSNDTDKSEEST